MTEKSTFTQAFADFQKDVTGILHELAGSTDYFRTTATYPLPAPPAPVQEKAKRRSTKKKDEEQDEEAAEQNEKEEDKTQNREFTQDEIDEYIIECSKRSSQDFKSAGFIKNIRRKVKGYDRDFLLKRIDVLIANGSIVPKTE